MTITTGDQLLNALANNASRIVIDKASVANQTAGRLCSLWRATGQPAQAAIPTTAAVPTKATLGALDFTNQTAPATSYLAWLSLLGANSAQGVEVHDRVAHLGGLSGITTSQTVTGLDLATLAPPAARLGAANYSDVQWFLEVYADLGTTAATITVNVTFGDASSANLAALTIGGAGPVARAGNMFALTPLIGAADQGKFIQRINSLTLSASTGTAGNFGFTCARQRTGLPILLANKPETYSWPQIGLPEIPNDSCLMLAVVPSTTSSGTVRGQGKIAHG